MLLLKFPQLCVDVKGPSEVSLPLLVPVLRHVAETVEQLLGLLQQVTELTDDLPLLLLHGVRHSLVHHSLSVDIETQMI